jgi:hypothetical protein
MEVNHQLHAPAALSLEKKTINDGIGGWVILRTGLDATKKRSILLLPEIKPRPSSPKPIAMPTLA